MFGFTRTGLAARTELTGTLYVPDQITPLLLRETDQPSSPVVTSHITDLDGRCPPIQNKNLAAGPSIVVIECIIIRWIIDTPSPQLSCSWQAISATLGPCVRFN
jgi:hypothetical protein